MSEPLIDPDCWAGKHRTCLGGPCECGCHPPGVEYHCGKCRYIGPLPTHYPGCPTLEKP